MTTAGCSRVWEAEAVSDGRLGAAERSSFERHAQSCAICRREVNELVALDAAMRELPTLESTPFERQRLRSRLLQRVDQELLGTAPRRMPVRSLGIVLASFVFVVGIGLGWAFGVGPRREEAPAAALLPEFELESANRASWDDRSVGSVARIVLRSGTVAVKVRHLHAPQRFLLVLPDGELEVHGTRFIVRIEGGRTARVDVTEGVVALRLEGRAERTLLAGDHWERSASFVSAPEPAPSGSSLSGLVPAPLQAPSPGVAPSSRAVESHPASSASSTPGRTASRAAPGDSGGSALSAEAARMPAETKPSSEAEARDVTKGNVPEGGFAAGVAAFRRGEYANAERLLGEFARSAPGDARREDAAFLRAVARSRQGDARGAAELAASYLRSFPNGLRRTEAERLVRAAGGTP